MTDAFNIAYKKAPTEVACDREITVDVVGTRCIYLNNYRIVGGKPYVSENLPSRSMKLTVRDALNAFKEDELKAYLKEIAERRAYMAGLRAYRDAAEATS